MKLGAYYQCFDNEKNVKAALTSFRAWYPEAPIILASDGGKVDYSEFCRVIGAEYIWNRHIPGKHLLSLCYEADGMCTFFRQLLCGIALLGDKGCTHVVLLEDDVRTLKRQTLVPTHALSGCNRNVRQHPGLLQCLFLKNGQWPVVQHYGGCGGCIFSVCFFKQLEVERVCSVLRDVMRIDTFDTSIIATDQAISFIVLYFGGSIVDNEEFGEVLPYYFPKVVYDVAENKIAFLHQWKRDY